MHPSSRQAIDMNDNHDNARRLQLPLAERRRRRREGILIVVIIFAVALLTFLETRTIYFGGNIPVSNTILMFILININLLLLLLLLFLVFRNLVKLFYDRKRRIVGSKLRTRLVVAFIALTLMPAAVLFFFSINFITTSIRFWFNVPVEQTIEHSLLVGRSLYRHIEKENRHLLERTAYQIEKKELLPPAKRKALNRYIQIVQREFFQDGVEVYDVSAKRLTYAVSDNLQNEDFERVPTEDLLRTGPEAKIHTISIQTAAGEQIRTISAIPFGATGNNIRGYVVTTKIISVDLARKMASISRGFSEYQQIKLLKRPIQISYYISLSIVGSLVAFCAIWFGFYLAKSISIPLKELSDGTRRVAEGDLGFTIAPVADDEIGGLVDSFNKMTADLRKGREQIELSARMLRQQNIEIEERRQYMEVVLKNVSTGVISTDAEGVITTVNTSAEKMLMIETKAA
jgi:two-component system nitrogen regulation sensor histidine kinase NtrY